MNCLEEILCDKYALVGIRDFINCPHPESILWVDDIPGIDLKKAAAIANSEQRTGYNLLNSKIKLATKKVFNKFSGMVSGNFTFNAVIETRQIDEFSEETIPAANIERGLSLTRWNSEAARIYIEEVYFKVEESGIAILKILDGDVVKNFSVSLQANVVNVFKVRYKAESENVKLVFNQENFTTFSCELDHETGCYSCGTSRRNDHTLDVMGWDGTEEQFGCYGLGVLANVQCYEENIICQVLPRMAFMIWYQAGIEILNEKINSDRINAITLFTKDKAAETINGLRNDLRAEEKMFTNNIKNYLKTTRGECFACKGSRQAYAKP